MRWFVPLSLVVLFLRILQLQTRPSFIPHEPSQTAFVALGWIVYVDIRWTTDIWQEFYLPAYYHCAAAKDTSIPKHLADSVWLGVFLVVIVAACGAHAFICYAECTTF